MIATTVVLLVLALIGIWTAQSASVHAIAPYAARTGNDRAKFWRTIGREQQGERENVKRCFSSRISESGGWICPPAAVATGWNHRHTIRGWNTVVSLRSQALVGSVMVSGQSVILICWYAGRNAARVASRAHGAGKNTLRQQQLRELAYLFFIASRHRVIMELHGGAIL